MKARVLFRYCLLASVLAALLFPASPAMAAGCDRRCLTTVLDRYLDALVKHEVSAAPLAPNAVFTENGTRLKAGDGLWKTATTVPPRPDTTSPITAPGPTESDAAATPISTIAATSPAATGMAGSSR